MADVVTAANDQVSGACARLVRWAVAGLMFATGGAQAAGATGASTYKLVKTVRLGAPDRWDYLTFDAASRRVYVAHEDRLSVVDARSGAIIGEVTGIPGGTHGIGFANGKGYTDDGEAGVAVVFDPKTLKVLKRIPAKPDADGIAVEPTTGHVFITDGESGAVTVIDPKTDRVIATIGGGGRLEFIVAGSDGKVYVNGAEKREVLRIDARTNAVDARWPVPSCENVHGLAIDPRAERLFVTCVNRRLMVLDAEHGTVVATLPIGERTDAAAFDPIRRRVFSSNGDGAVTVIAERSPNDYRVIDTVSTQKTGRTMTIDPRSGRLYVAAGDLDPAPLTPRPGGRPGRPKIRPGTLKLLFLDPVK